MSASPPALIVVLDGAAPGALPPRLAALPHAVSRLAASGAAVGLPDGKRADAEAAYATLGAGRPVPPRAAAIETLAASGKLVLADALHLLFRTVHNQSAPGQPVVPGVPASFEEDRRSSLHVFTLLSGSAGRPSKAVRDALLAAAAHDGVRVRVHAMLDHGITVKHAVRELEILGSTLGEACTLATLSGRRHGFDASGDVAGAWLLFQAAIRGGGDVPMADDWFDVIASAQQDRLCLEDVVPHRLGGYAGARGSLFADFAAPGASGPEWYWRSEDSALLLGSRPTDFADLARLLRRTGLAPDEARLLEERGRRVVAFEGPTLASLVPIEGPALPDAPDEDWIDSLLPRDPPRAASLLADLAARGSVLAAAPRSRRHAIEFLGGGAIPARVEQVLVDTDRDEPELSARALAAPVRAALDAGGRGAVVVCVPELDRAAHRKEEEAAFRAARAIDQAVAPLVSAVLERGGVVCVVSPFARGGEERESSDAACWFFGSAELEPRGELADFAPTLADRLGMQPVAGATGRSLLRR